MNFSVMDESVVRASCCYNLMFSTELVLSLLSKIEDMLAQVIFLILSRKQQVFCAINYNLKILVPVLDKALSLPLIASRIAPLIARVMAVFALY